MYVMRTERRDGSAHESPPSVAEALDATEGRLVLMAVRDALQRMNYACSITVHTESAYIASAISNGWMEAWERDGWRNAKGKEVRDSTLWAMIYRLVEEDGHVLSAEQGAHEYAQWMRWRMAFTDALPGVFSGVREEPVRSVRD
ncbi:MAG: hypothetical protein NC331_11460 [Lachnospiraceae bacterium]|nr:hypothetical protein [Lachnospiraceae bacterium]